MIREFLDSWALFHNVYLVGWSIGLLLSLVGVLVVARNQIFLSAAVAQASTLGVAVGMWVAGRGLAPHLAWLESDVFLSALAVLFAIIATMISAHRHSLRGHSAEAVTGWVFLVSASTAILLMAHSPHGLEEIHRLLLSSIIGAGRHDVWVFGVLLGLSGALIVVLHRRILLFSLDPAMATAAGMNVRAWGIATSGWLGLSAGLSMRASGMLYTFGCLVLPALIAASLCREVRTMFLVAPLVAVLSAGAGFVLANHYDYPPAQVIVVLMCLLLAATWIVRGIRG